jgi:hypothetical protein
MVLLTNLFDQLDAILVQKIRGDKSYPILLRFAEFLIIHASENFGACKKKPTCSVLLNITGGLTLASAEVAELGRADRKSPEMLF